MPNPLYIGIDVSRANLEVCEWPNASTIVFENNVLGVQKLIEWMSARIVSVVAFEHTGWITRDLADGLRDAKIPSVILDGKKVRYFAKVIGREAKTDRLDARLIARFAATLRPNASALPTQQERDLQDIAHRYRQIVVWIAGEKGKLQHGYAETSQQSIQDHLLWLEKESAHLETSIDQRIAERPDWHRRSQIIKSMPSCGPGAVRALISDLPELGRTPPKRLASLVGLVPVPFESGEVVKPRRFRGGRYWVRQVLYMCSLTGTRHNPVLRRYYSRLVAAGKPPMSARAATMRKMLIILNAMVRDDRMWEARDDGVPIVPP